VSQNTKSLEPDISERQEEKAQNSQVEEFLPRGESQLKTAGLVAEIERLNSTIRDLKNQSQKEIEQLVNQNLKSLQRAKCAQDVGQSPEKSSNDSQNSESKESYISRLEEEVSYLNGQISSIQTSHLSEVQALLMQKELQMTSDLNKIMDLEQSLLDGQQAYRLHYNVCLQELKSVFLKKKYYQDTDVFMHQIIQNVFKHVCHLQTMIQSTLDIKIMLNLDLLSEDSDFDETFKILLKFIESMIGFILTLDKLIVAHLDSADSKHALKRDLSQISERNSSSEGTAFIKESRDKRSGFSQGSSQHHDWQSQEEDELCEQAIGLQAEGL